MLWPEVACSEVTAPSLVTPSKDGNRDLIRRFNRIRGMTELGEEEHTIFPSMWLFSP